MSVEIVAFIYIVSLFLLPTHAISVFDVDGSGESGESGEMRAWAQEHNIHEVKTSTNT